MVNLCVIHSLNRPRFTSFVTIARVVSTSTDDHNLNDYIRRSHIRCNASVYLKLAKAFDAIEELNELVLASVGIFSRLGATGVRIGCTRS